MPRSSVFYNSSGLIFILFHCTPRLIWLPMTLISLWDGTLPTFGDKLFLRPCLVGSVGQMVPVCALTAVQRQPASALVLQMEPVLLIEQGAAWAQ